MKIWHSESEEEAQAVKAAAIALGLDPDAPLCSYCNSDWHVRPDCPTKALQERERRILRDKEQRDLRELTVGKARSWRMK